MSISLKNHEDRIKALENKTSTSSLSRTLLWSGNSNANGFSVTLNQSYQNFDLLLMSARCYNVYGNYIYNADRLLDASVLRVGSSYSHTVGSLGYFTINSITKFTFPDQLDIGITAIYGLKLYYSFSYNIIYRAMHLLEKIFLCLKQRRC